ncbi:MAG: energy transducer TonB [Saprospiraceae bacterium]
MKKEAKDKHFIKKPIYEGGPTALKKFIGENLQYPKEALDNKIQGTVYVKYDIDRKGKVTDAKVIKGIGHGCDEEAIRLAKLLRFKVPTTRGVRVIFHNNIQIHFRLPKKKPAPKVAAVAYSYVEKKKEVPAEEKKSGGYTITYNF